MLVESRWKARPGWCLTALLVWTWRLALGLFFVALAVGHFHPSDRDPVESRTPVSFPPVIVKGGESWRPEAGGLWVDPTTGATSTLPVPSGGRLSDAVMAPWRDQVGGTQAVGGWISQGLSDLPTGSYLARIALPGGTILDAVALTSILDGPPCWFPGDADRILFAQQDGELYEFTFPAERRWRLEDRPRRLAWRVVRPLGEGSRFHSPIWPRDPRLGGRILVSVEPRVVGSHGPDFQELWWLQLDEAGTTVEAAGPLDPQPGRMPVVATDRDGGLILAYLIKVKGEPGYELRLAPIELDSSTGVPAVATERTRVLATRCHLTPPVFSADGSSVFAVSEESTRLDLRRIPLDRFLPASKPILARQVRPAADHATISVLDLTRHPPEPVRLP